ncbi:MAG: glycosyltransferase family 2 protein [bacterium]
MSATALSLSLFLPAYNEAPLIESTVRKAVAVLEATCDTFEVIVVDDGSTDGTGVIADRLAAADRRVRVIHHAGNQGYGKALRTGFAAGAMDVVAYTDVDEPADLWLLRDAVQHLATHDLVIGYRLQRYSTLHRRLFTWSYNRLVRLLFGVKVRDINFSFKLIRRDALQAIRLSANSVFIDGELLVEAQRLGLRMCEVPVDDLQRTAGTSNFNGLRPALETLREIARYRARPRG